MVLLTPAPNGAGWNNTPVTASFTCADTGSGVSTCPSPILFDTDGEAQTVTVYATDVATNQGSAMVTVNIDHVASVVSIATPANNSTTANSSISLTGSAEDVLSGVVAATCNGLAATVVNGDVSCSVDVWPGRNSLVLFTMDAAGNSVSASVRVMRTVSVASFVITPVNVTLLTEESRQLRLVDQAGIAAVEPLWTSSDEDVATVDEETGVVTAISAGEVTITAAASSLSAEAVVTVAAGAALSEGTSRWTVPSTPGFTLTGSPIYGVGPS